MYRERERRVWTGKLWWLAGVAVAFVFPLILSQYYLFVLANIIIMAIVAQGLNTMIGWGAVFSFGQPGFMAFGAYFGAILARELPFLPFPIVIILTAIASALLGLLIGYPCLRLRGFFLAMATFGFSSSIFVLINFLRSLTGGNEGMYAPPPAIGGISFANTTNIFFIVFLIGLLIQFGVSNINRSRTGRAWRAIRDGEIPAASMGINIAKEKIKLFILGSVLAGVGGVLYSYLIGYLQSDFFSIMGLSFFLILVSGGIGTVWGPIIGSFIFMMIPQVFGGMFSQSMNLVYGVILIGFVSLAPGGVYQILGKLQSVVRRGV